MQNLIYTLNNVSTVRISLSLNNNQNRRISGEALIRFTGFAAIVEACGAYLIWRGRINW